MSIRGLGRTSGCVVVNVGEKLLFTLKASFIESLRVEFTFLYHAITALEAMKALPI